MLKYPIYANGQKLVREDLVASARVGGVADDEVRATLKQIPIEQTTRLGYVEAWRDGPIVVGNGATGQVKVQPFQIYRSPVGASSGGGTVDAVATSEDQHTGLATAFYSGGVMTVTTPLPSSGNFRWDLLYAIYSDTDSDPAARLVKDPGTGIISAQTINTRHAPAVTLAWALGSNVANATDPVLVGSLPTIPTALAGQANAPLAYVLVSANGTPSTVAYGVDQIANWSYLAQQNPNSGVADVVVLPGGRDGANGVATWSDITTLLTLPSASGGWNKQSTGGHRPIRFIETAGGGVKAWIPIEVGPGAAPTSWTVLANPIASPVVSDPTFRRCKADWRNRWFHSHLYLSDSANLLWAHDQNPGGNKPAWPSGYSYAGSNIVPFPSTGESVTENQQFNSASGLSGYRLAAYYQAVTGSGTHIGLFVSSSTGALHLGWIQNNSFPLTGLRGLIVLDATPYLFPYGL